MNLVQNFRDLVPTKPMYINILAITLSSLLFLLSIQLLADSFGFLGRGYAEYFLQATSNPSIGLFIGLIATAILQSSSTTTSMAVAAVAAGSLTLQNAIPIVMGANIGTTLTSTIVSMSYVTKTTEFRKAISAGTIHDIFNVLLCLIVFPLEVKYGLLSNLSQSIASLITFGNTPGTQIADKFFIYALFHDISNFLLDLAGPYIVLVVAAILLVITVKSISGILYEQLIGKARSRFENAAFSTTFKSFGWGFLLTSAIQSSSLTTSLIVPLVATGKVHLNRAFQFIIGANLGTTITALLAALFKSEAAMSLAVAHFVFNSIGVILFLGIPFLHRIPLYLAAKLGSISLRYKLTAFAYILVVFFILPFTLIYLFQ